ncbi:MMPL family transporter [Bacillus sp. EB600]|uniref:MMPL family transporter n=1 Tax=Bacillus sp. EB600 TaxID=2806345 RepID=UPI00210B26CB|nr:MMPL family transporter [Bacillus sp. EB600]MCQ6279150.1 MMPL family transporter [Bacillus sp. EB600]
MKEVHAKENSGKDVQTALVFHSDKKLTTEDFSEARKAVNQLEDHEKQLGITSITSHFKQKKLKNEFVSKDIKTILVSLKVLTNGREGKEISKDLYKAIDNTKLEHYYTGSWMIDGDLVTNSQEGLKKTEGITVVFILAVLLLVFRSVVAPLIPLVTVGIRYLSAQSIVAMLVDKVNCGQMDQLTNGLTQSVDGLNQVSTGLNSVQDYLAGVSNQKQNGFYIPTGCIKWSGLCQSFGYVYVKVCPE